MTTVERVACKDAGVFKLYMDFVLVIHIWKRCFPFKNCLSLTLEMYLHPPRFFSLDLCFGIPQRIFLDFHSGQRKQILQIGAASAKSQELVDDMRNGLPVSVAKHVP